MDSRKERRRMMEEWRRRKRRTLKEAKVDGEADEDEVVEDAQHQV